MNPVVWALTSCLVVYGLTLVTTPAQSQDLRPSFVVNWSSADTGRIDRGIGITYFAVPAGSNSTDFADTLLLRNAPSARAAIIGAFLYHEVQGGIAWRYGVAASKRLQPNILEYGYEESGVPLDSLVARQDWGRAILGFDENGDPFRGWVRLDSTRARYLLWRKVLAGNRVFFLPGIPPQFYNAAQGKPVQLTVQAGSNADYIMHPIEARGAWLKVRVAQPADMCGGPEDGQVRNSIVWIRYLTPHGRPRVWYYTRGC